MAPHDHHDSCCGHDHDFTGLSPTYRRILVFVALINFIMFAVEAVGGHLVGSLALQADALDFLADGITYSISLWAIYGTVTRRARVALLKGLSLVVMGLYVFGASLYNAFVLQVPEAYPMGVIALLALVTNLLSVLLLYRWREGDANVRSVWLCSRNDAIGNVAVFGAAGLVAYFGSAWPDVIVAGLMAGLFLSSAWQILRKSTQELKKEK